ncbi:WXG100 family type VII secretion target [Actinocatenispora rupis]|uniref:WXG100 family type VII secretion target n=1 Tax=Actinocatenispora rupis TaxID=519421 RepID=UPI001940EBBF|nr:hypothetical protein [Actinocatenispora rupis]
MTADSFQINPTAVRAVTATVSGLTGQMTDVIGSLESAVLDGLAYAGVGSPVAGASATWQSQLVSCLRSAAKLLDGINGHVTKASDDYASADAAVAQGYGGQPAAQTATAQQPGQLDPRVVRSIMRSEGASGEQGGIRELYGFRQSEHNGYDQILAARNRYGQGSPEETAVVSRLLSDHARAAGALNFTDPGVQAAIVSGAHMRGAGGVQAILNSMVTGDIHKTGHLTQQTIQTVQQMSPQDFQSQFHDARIAYDKAIYGNTTTHQGGHTDTWWHRYGTGLTDRYDREEQQFLGMSGTP